MQVNCGAMPEELLASELFGHEKGAFTGASETSRGLFEAADGGTLFLDEIGDMPLAMQIKLLRVLQEREVRSGRRDRPRPVDVRFLAATNRDLRKRSSRGASGSDLYSASTSLTLRLPPLRDRRDDIPLLACYFLDEGALRMGQAGSRGSTPRRWPLLEELRLPGQRPRTGKLIQRGVALATGRELSCAQLPPALVDRAIRVVRATGEQLPTLDQRDTEYISWVLKRTGGNRSRAAEILGIDRVSLWRKLKTLDAAD